jgi:hypothetical protein
MKHVVEIEADREERVMASIIATRPSDNNLKQHVFLVESKDYAQEENMWETYENVAELNM